MDGWKSIIRSPGVVIGSTEAPMMKSQVRSMTLILITYFSTEGTVKILYGRWFWIVHRKSLYYSILYRHIVWFLRIRGKPPEWILQRREWEISLLFQSTPGRGNSKNGWANQQRLTYFVTWRRKRMPSRKLSSYFSQSGSGIIVWTAENSMLRSLLQIVSLTYKYTI